VATLEVLMTTEIETDTDTEERRITPRYGVDLPVRLWSEPEDASERVEILSGQVRDVSWGGLFVCTGAAEPIGSTMGLLVSMPQHRDPVPLRGRVAWVSNGGPKGPGLGIRLQTAL
jgi:hypothetical protein